MAHPQDKPSPTPRPEESVKVSPTLRAALRKTASSVHVTGALSSAVLAFLGLSIPLFALVVFDWITPTRTPATLNMIFAGLLTAFAFMFAITVVRRFALLHTARRTGAILADALYPGISTPQQGTRGARSSILVSHISTIKSYYTSGAPHVFWDAGFSVVFLGALFAMQPMLGSVVMFAIPLFLLMTLQATKAIYKDTRAKILASAVARHLGSTAENGDDEDTIDLDRYDMVSGIWASLFNIEFWQENKLALTKSLAKGLQLFVMLLVFYLGSRMVIQSAPITTIEAWNQTSLSQGSLIAITLLTYMTLQPFVRLVAAAGAKVMADKALNQLEQSYQPRLTRLVRQQQLLHDQRLRIAAPAVKPATRQSATQDMAA